jgi:signal transduction histidine kinase
LDGAESRVPLGQSVIGLIGEERRPRVTNSLVEDSGSEQEWAKREGMVAFVGQPLLVEGRLVGVAAAYARKLLDDVGLSSFVSAAGEIAQCIERRRVEEALRGSEEQIRQLQKMEAVGRLAGGVAHDFNNLLTVISGHSQLLLRQMPPGDPLREGLDLIETTAVRAGWLTRQLLTFSRKQNVAPVVLDPNEVVSGMAAMLERLIAEDIDLVFRPGSSLGRVRVDPGQLEQVIVNLVVNARDAMPAGGRITVETANVELDEEYARTHVGVRPGWYGMLAVSDAGIGMDAETQSHIFEPFFTTKEPGKGTGLGLATVYGIVKQSDGTIWVQSQPGQGTTFKIYFPLTDAPLAPAAPGPGLGEAPEGAETILLVEDQADVRLVVRRVLQSAGYTVLETSTPGDALELVGRHTGPIHLVLTDIVMPQMNGRVLVDLLKPRCPAMRVVYMSGYADTLLDPGTAYLQKPFTPDKLVRTVREVLDTVGT